MNNKTRGGEQDCEMNRLAISLFDFIWIKFDEFFRRTWPIRQTETREGEMNV